MSEATQASLVTAAVAAIQLVPPGWMVRCVPGTAEVPSEDPVNWHEYWSGSKEVGGLPEIRVPCPESPASLFVFLHEIGHVVLGHAYQQVHHSQTLVGEIEILASLWAYTFMHGYGIRPPDVSRTLAVAMARTQAFGVKLSGLFNPGS